MNSQSQNIIKPLMTEKSTFLSEHANTYGFLVKKFSNKYQIRLEVEKLYDVKVINVNTVLMPGKSKRSAKNGQSKKENNFKKAWVKIQAGQKIKFFKDI